MNVRASYYDETREQVENLWNVLKMHKIGIIYQDDAFGSAVLDGNIMPRLPHWEHSRATPWMLIKAWPPFALLTRKRCCS